MTRAQFYDRRYSRIGERGSKWRELCGVAKARNIISIVENLPVGSVIDIGCGTGAVLAECDRAAFGKQYYAADISSEAISIVRNRSGISRLVEAQVSDGRHIPYHDHQFSLAILSHVIEHVVDPACLLREAARVAWYIAIEVPIENNLHIYLKTRILRRDYRQGLGHVQCFSKRSFRALLERTSGLEVMRMGMAFVPDRIYFFRKEGKPGALVSLSLCIRKVIRSLSSDLYSRLLTDHCIALVRSS